MMYRSIFGQIRALLLLGIVSASTVYAASATISSEAESLINVYIVSLSAGDVDEIKSVIGGTLLERSKRSLDTGEKYGAFLRKHYNGVQMSVSLVEQSGDQCLVSVLFVYPSGDTETTVFTVGEENGQPRIIDEKM
jgi:hypothetical protein